MVTDWYQNDSRTLPDNNTSRLPWWCLSECIHIRRLAVRPIMFWLIHAFRVISSERLVLRSSLYCSGGILATPAMWRVRIWVNTCFTFCAKRKNSRFNLLFVLFSKHFFWDKYTGPKLLSGHFFISDILNPTAHWTGHLSNSFSKNWEKYRKKTGK